MTPSLAKLAPQSGAFACALFQAVAAPGATAPAGANLPSARGGLAFLGVFLI
ncbi:MAG: hypothetical protein L0Z50_33825 [Verrucomicrobiales bacterium]|nr:hypothetical protein [Verrucomicrobiales bacterium]